MYRQIFIIIILLILSIGVYILIVKERSEIENRIEVPKIVVPKKSITFKIVKSQNGEINFKGTFVDENSSKEIKKFLNGYRVLSDITIDKNRETDRDIILFIEKILKRLDSSFREWTILYKDRKLLVSGKSIDIKSKKRLDSLMELSTLNCFSDIELIQPKDNPLEIISNLKSVIENNIRRVDRKIKKKIVRKKRTIKKEETIFKDKKVLEKDIEIEPAKIIPISYSEAKSLPNVEIIDDIEKFDKKININRERVIDKGTIYLNR